MREPRSATPRSPSRQAGSRPVLTLPADAPKGGRPRARQAETAAPGYCLFDTRLGPMGTAWTDQGLLAVQLPEVDAVATELGLVIRASRAQRAEPPEWVRRAIGEMARLVDKGWADLSAVPLDLRQVPEFHRRVYLAARGVGPGATATYGQLAVLAGAPGAARAVGQAMGKNPLPLVVPCHRIVAAGGKLGGYGGYGGLGLKKRLLELERRYLAEVDGGGLPFDAAMAVARLKKADPALGRIIARIGPCGLRLRSFAGPFEALMESIVYQQLTGKAAATILSRVKALYGDRLPSPRELLDTDDARLRGAGLSGGKRLALRDLASRCEAGQVPTIEEMRGLSDEALIDRLSAVRGVGRWTVEMLLIFRLGRPDVLPVADLGVRKGFAYAFRKRELPLPDELLRRGERWRPYRTVASWYLWRAAELSRG